MSDADHESSPPKPLDYARPPERTRGSGAGWRFAAGMFGGVALSGIYFAVGEAGFQGMIIFGTIVKVFLAIVMLMYPRWRFVGVGMFTSMAVVSLIVVGYCFVSLGSGLRH